MGAVPAALDAGATDAVLFPAKPAVVEVGGEQCPILPLNLYGLKMVLGCIKTSIAPLASGYNAFIKAQLAYEADRTLTAPDPLWFFAVIIDDIDNVYDAVTQVLRRGNTRITREFVDNNLEPFVHLPLIWDKFVAANNLAAFAKKLMESELGSLAQIFLQSRKSSNSPTSSSTSAGTTESGSTT